MNLQNNYDSFRNNQTNSKLILRNNIVINRKNSDQIDQKKKHLSIKKFQQKDHSKDGSLKGKDLLLKRLNSANSKFSSKLSQKMSKQLTTKTKIKHDDSANLKEFKESKKLKIIPRQKQIQIKNENNIKKRFKFGRSNDNLQSLQIKQQQTSASPTLRNLRCIRKKTSNFDFSKHLEQLKQKNALNKQNSQTTQDESQTKNLQPKVKEFQFKKLHFSKKSIELRPKTNQTEKQISEKKSQENTTKTNKVKLMSKHIKLDQKISFKARSIEFKKRQKELKTNINKHVKNFLSEDKDKDNFMLNEEKPKLNHISHPEQIKIIPTKTKHNNRYYQYLKKKLKDQFAQGISKQIKNAFKNWKEDDHAEFYKKFQTSIGFYEIKNMIGQGCFGKVFLAKQALTGRMVALKVITRSNIQNKDTLKKIHKEVRILKKLNNHSGVIKLYEVFEDEGFVYLVFEFAEKGDLVQYFKINPLLDESVLKSFFRKILYSVQYIHKNDIIHRDIKLDNILLDKDMNPKLCDFGISSEYDKTQVITDTGGTPAYLAPEVIKAQGEVSLKSDMWSLGVLLYLLGFGHVPFQAKNMQHLYGKILQGQYDLPKQDYLSENFQNLIKKLLTVNPQKRLDINQALQHKWFENEKKEKQKEKQKLSINEKERLKIDAINYYLLDIGFPYSYIQQTFKKNLFNHVKACTDALYIKFGIVNILQMENIEKNQQEKKLIITPNEVRNDTGEAIDYDKLINEFGTKKLTQEQIDRFQKLTGVKEIHPLLKRGIFFSHRDFDLVLDYFEKGKEIYLYTGRGPSTDSMHLGHLLPFIICKYLQDALKCPIVIQLTDDEKYFYQKTKEESKKKKDKQQDLDWFSEIAIENAKDIIACGYDVKNTFIFRNTDYMQHLYPHVVRLQRHITYNQIKGIFGLNGSENTGKVAFPAIQAVPCISKAFPHIFKGKEQALCLIPCGIDQDPYFRMTRDIAQKLKFPKPCSIYSKFFPALQGWDKKMSSSDPNSAIFLKDTPNQIKKKINKYAFSGGQVDIDTHRKLGANLDVDISYQYLRFFYEDDKELEEIGEKYKKGELLTSEVKKTLIEILQNIIKGHQDRRAQITKDIVLSFMKVRPF